MRAMGEVQVDAGFAQRGRHMVGYFNNPTMTTCRRRWGFLITCTRLASSSQRHKRDVQLVLCVRNVGRFHLRQKCFFDR